MDSDVDARKTCSQSVIQSSERNSREEIKNTSSQVSVRGDAPDLSRRSFSQSVVSSTSGARSKTRSKGADDQNVMSEYIIMKL